MGAVVETSHQLNGVGNDLLGRLRALFNHDSWGNMGPELYRNGGAARFENILTSTYNPYVGETKLIADNLDTIAMWARDIDTVVLVGPGPARSIEAKEIPILKGLSKLKKIVSIELSPDFNKQSGASLHEAFPDVEIVTVQDDFRKLDSQKIGITHPALVISTGSFTNFENCPNEHFPHKQVRDHLLCFKGFAGRGGKVLWGYDSSTDDQGYNLPEVSDFLLYPLEKASRIDGVVLDPRGFAHETHAHSISSVLTHEWVAIKDQDVTIGGDVFAISQGERFSMFASVKLEPTKLERFVSSLNMPSGVMFRETGGAVLHGFDCK